MSSTGSPCDPGHRLPSSLPGGRVGLHLGRSCGCSPSAVQSTVSVSGQLSTQSLHFHHGQSRSPCPHSHDGDKNGDNTQISRSRGPLTVIDLSRHLHALSPIPEQGLLAHLTEKETESQGAQRDHELARPSSQGHVSGCCLDHSSAPHPSFCFCLGNAGGQEG